MPSASRAETDVLVIGAGIGGLSAALSCAARGARVTVLERADVPGGKARGLDVAGRLVEAGPTVFTMRWVFEELFAAAGCTLEGALGLKPAEVLARHAWPDGSRFDLYADLERTSEAVSALSGPAEAARYRDFAARTARDYALFRDSFIAAQRPGPLDIVARIGLARLPALFAARPMHGMWGELCRHLTDPRLRQLFGRYATYCGSSPFRAPATLMQIAHVEREGVWLVEGGISALARAIATCVEALGGTLRMRADVARIDSSGGRAIGAVLTSGERIPAGSVIFNGDAAALSAGLLGRPARGAVAPQPPHRRSYSALVWSAVAEVADFPLSHHTVVFGPDYRAEFDAMEAGRLPRDPTTYVCAQDRDAAGGPAPTGPERLHIQVNAPATGDRPGGGFSEEEIARCREETEALMARAGLTLDLGPQTARLTAPKDFAALFPGTGGALYGAATHGAFASFSRPSARSRLPGLYLAGGSTHPGAGVPMAALSGRLAAEAWAADRASTRRSHPAAIAGGISTRSRTTDSTA